MLPSGIESGLRLARLCKALGHPARVLILRYLLAHPAGCSCGDIVAQLPLAQSTVSQHLRVLAGVGLVRATPMRPRVLWAAEPGAVAELHRATGALTAPPRPGEA